MHRIYDGIRYFVHFNSILLQLDLKRKSIGRIRFQYSVNLDSTVI